SFEAFGVKFALSGGAALDAAIELAEKNPAWPVEVPAADRKAAIDRANAHRSVFEGAEILWVDDRPSNNRNEARMRRSFGALITLAARTDEASRALQTPAEQHQPSTSSCPTLAAICRHRIRPPASRCCHGYARRGFTSRSSITSAVPSRAPVCQQAP